MKIIDYFRSLFKFTKPAKTLLTKHDIFGAPINEHELVYPVKYNEVKRRGYLTIGSQTTGVNIENVTDAQYKLGVIAHSTLIRCKMLGKVKNSKRGNFYHVYR